MSNNKVFHPFPPKQVKHNEDEYHNLNQWNRMTSKYEEKRFIERYKESFVGKTDFVNTVQWNREFYNDLPSSLYYYYNLYPKFIRENDLFKHACVILDRCHPFLTFHKKQDFLNDFAEFLMPHNEDEEQDAFNALWLNVRLPLTRNNAIRMSTKYWEKERVQEDEWDELTDEEEELKRQQESVNAIIEEMMEEENKKIKKKEEARAKKEAEEAKDQGKEAYDAYLKKIEDEKKKLEDEEAKKEEEEESKQKEEEEVVEEGVQMGMDEQEGEEAEKNEQEEDEELLKGDETTFEGWDIRPLYDPQTIIGVDPFRKSILEEDLPEIKFDEQYLSAGRRRYHELYLKTQKLLLTEEEKEEFMTLNETKFTNPEYYSEITGIPIEELNTIREKKKSFKEKYFVELEGKELPISESDLQLLEEEVTNLEIMGQKKDECFTIMDAPDEGDDEYYVPPIPDFRKRLNPNHIFKIPIDYYDNDDGFWDEYIQEKKERFNPREIKQMPFIGVYKDIKGIESQNEGNI